MNNGEKRKVYLESTIFGYLTGRPSAIPKTAYWQALTRQWWENCLPKVDCFVSRWVISESEDGDADAVERRKAVLKDFPEIRPAADKVATLAQRPSTRVRDGLNQSQIVETGNERNKPIDS